jgi:hypothetical protein
VTGRRGRPLTARGLKAILTRAGVDHSALEIRDDPAIWTNVETGERGTSVVVSGPKEPRRQVSRVLYDRGLACAPYSGRDEWSRPGGGIWVAGPARETEAGSAEWHSGRWVPRGNTESPGGAGEIG